MLSKKIVVVVFSVLSISISALPNIENVKSDNEIITPGITGNIETKKLYLFGMKHLTMVSRILEANFTLSM